MRALPDAPSTCDEFTVTGQSTMCLYVKCEKMLALSSDYKTLSRDVRHFNTKFSCGIVLAVSESQAEI